jgi:hypothetical protein
MGQRARAGLAGETMGCAPKGAVRHCLTGKAASAKVAGAKIARGESVRTASLETAGMKAVWPAAAHPDAAAVRHRGVKTAARMETATTHPHAAAAHVEATATTMEAATAPAHVEAAPAAMETAAAPAMSTPAATTVSAPTATTAVAGGRCIGRHGSHHRHARQKCEGKLALHVTPVSKSALSAARTRSAFIRDTRPELKRLEGRSGFDVRQLILRKVALHYADHYQRCQLRAHFLFVGGFDDRARRR